MVPEPKQQISGFVSSWKKTTTTVGDLWGWEVPLQQVKQYLKQSSGLPVRWFRASSPFHFSAHVFHFSTSIRPPPHLIYHPILRSTLATHPHVSHDCSRSLPCARQQWVAPASGKIKHYRKLLRIEIHQKCFVDGPVLQLIGENLHVFSMDSILKSSFLIKKFAYFISPIWM